MPNVGETTAHILGLPTDSLQPGDVRFSLTCAVCGKGISLTGKARPQSASEIVALAERHNIPHVMDFAYSRVVIFCSNEHIKMAMTKDGRLKKRIPRATTG